MFILADTQVKLKFQLTFLFLEAVPVDSTTLYCYLKVFNLTGNSNIISFYKPVPYCRARRT